ncbi:MAG: FecR family protein [Sphingobium sp.]
MTIGSYFSRARRIERQAYKWAMLMLDDPHRHMESLNNWMAKSPEHRATYKRVVTEVGVASDAAAMLPELRAEAATEQPAATWGWPFRIALVAAMVLIALVGVVSYLELRNSHGSPPQLADAQVVSNQTGEKEVSLADGSTVTLFGTTSIKVLFSDEARSIYLSGGRARFNGSHDPTRPFVVYVKGGKVTAVGTIFEVRVDDHVEVRLLEGKVRVTMTEPQSAARSREVVLSPGEKVRFTGGGAAATPDPEPDSMPQSQRQTRTFDDVPVSTIITEVNRNSDLKIELADPALGQEKIFAELNVSDADAVARRLAAILGLSIDRSVQGRVRLKK